MPGDEKHFYVSRMLQCCCKFMKMLFRKLFLTPAWWQTTPRTRSIRLWDRSADPTQEANRMGSEDSHFDYECLILSLVFAEGLRSQCWKHETINDLHHFAFNQLWQTTSSVPQPSRLTYFPSFYLYCAFELRLKAATLKQTWPRGSPTPDRIAPNSTNSSIQTNQVATVLLHHSLLVTFHSRNHNFVAVFSLCSCEDHSKDMRISTGNQCDRVFFWQVTIKRNKKKRK